MKPLHLSIALALSCCTVVAQTHIANCEVFPADNIWNATVRTMPVHARSATYINTIGADLSLRNDFGSGLWNGAPIGIPYVLVGNGTPKQTITFDYTDESDQVGYPVPPNPPIEGGSNSTGDRHVLIVDTSACTLYELYHAKYVNDHWTAGSGAVFDLTSNALRPDTWTSADAAGLPILPGLVRYEEVASGAINHMIRFTVPKTSRAYLWPARHFASSITDPAYPPMGLVMRLKSTFDTSKLAPQARVIARALMIHGMILADNGSAWYMSGAPDERWNMDDLYTLRQIHGRDFEAVDVGPLMVSLNSGKVASTTTVAVDVPSTLRVTSSGGTIEISCEEAGRLRSVDDVQLFDQLGRVVPLTSACVNLNGKNITIALDGLPAGLLFVHIGRQTIPIMN